MLGDGARHLVHFTREGMVGGDYRRRPRAEETPRSVGSLPRTIRQKHAVTHQGDEATACYYPTVKNLSNITAEDRLQFDGGRSRTALLCTRRKAAGRQFYSAPRAGIANSLRRGAVWAENGDSAGHRECVTRTLVDRRNSARLSACGRQK